MQPEAGVFGHRAAKDFAAAKKRWPGTAAMPWPESSHPYADDTDRTWSYSIPGAAALAVSFDERISVEYGYDYIVVTGGPHCAGKWACSRDPIGFR